MTGLGRVSPQTLARWNYWVAWRRLPDLRSPITFDEKLLWLNFFWQHPLKTECGDKYTLRGYVERQGLTHLLPVLYGVYESVQGIDFDALPERFVLKCTHGCKCNVFCENKAALDLAAVRRDLTRWSATDYSRLAAELHYHNMTPRIVCEEFLNDGTGVLPTDYKVFCFNGRPSLILCATDRDPNGKGKRMLVDVSWNRSPLLLRQECSRGIPRPEALPEILRASEKLSAEFPFARVDFYCIGKRPVLGEMTFTPNACTNRDYAQLELGRCIQLPPPWVSI
jgi:hypothetical protein